jgi:endonuclease/exonuclease/phosphatase family metal-dependent hydrolase
VAVTCRTLPADSGHTSPSVVAEGKRRADLGTRSCERHPWWTDAFLADLRLVMVGVDTSVLIAGDLNQARAYDAASGHRCGGEFLDAVADLGFVDVTVRDWGGERATRRSPDYHLDRVFASRQLADQMRVDDIELVDDNVSDHAPVWFSLYA